MSILINESEKMRNLVSNLEFEIRLMLPFVIDLQRMYVLQSNSVGLVTMLLLAMKECEMKKYTIRLAFVL